MQSLLGVFVGVDSLGRILCDGSGRFSSAGRRAPGFRERDNGGLVDVGNSGYSWSSTSYGSGGHYRGMYLDFNATALYPCYTTYRAYGLQLRCLSE
ncbi:hypothetical protein [uncultured Rikenella sp.]|uniref:hypothetical protein n=1 Tax=uncultured Rikenella sp. TaxID=368003 RepID=UPI00260FD09F|nr:hypothetical protein [uncultured Rikenella sp.]